MNSNLWFYPNILNHRDYKFLLRSNQIRRIKSGVIFQPSTECNVNKLDLKERKTSKNTIHTHKLWDNNNMR